MFYNIVATYITQATCWNSAGVFVLQTTIVSRVILIENSQFVNSFVRDIQILGEGALFMTTVERILALQQKNGLNNKALEQAVGLANASITSWKSGKYAPSTDAIIKLAKFFDVSADYLLCISEQSSRTGEGISLTEEEELLLRAFHISSAGGRFRIIQLCMNELDRAEKGENEKGG